MPVKWSAVEPKCPQLLPFDVFHDQWSNKDHGSQDHQQSKKKDDPGCHGCSLLVHVKVTGAPPLRSQNLAHLNEKKNQAVGADTYIIRVSQPPSSTANLYHRQINQSHSFQDNMNEWLQICWCFYIERRTVYSLQRWPLLSKLRLTVLLKGTVVIVYGSHFCSIIHTDYKTWPCATEVQQLNTYYCQVKHWEHLNN